MVRKNKFPKIITFWIQKDSEKLKLLLQWTKTQHFSHQFFHLSFQEKKKKNPSTIYSKKLQCLEELENKQTDFKCITHFYRL